MISKEGGAINDPALILAYSSLHFGGRRHFKNACDTLKLDRFRQLIDLEKTHFTIKDPLPGHYMMVQRCHLCLRGVATIIGVGVANAAEFWRPAAEQFLLSQRQLAKSDAKTLNRDVGPLLRQ